VLLFTSVDKRSVYEWYSVLFDGISVSSSNTTDGFDIAEALLKAELKTHEL
jgi:hypothetical protein